MNKQKRDYKNLARRYFLADVRANENWVQSLARVLGNVLRWFLIVIVLTVLISFVAYLIVMEIQKNVPQNKIIYEVDHNTEVCGEKFPIRIMVKNPTKKWLQSVSITVKATNIGHSTNIIKPTNEDVDWDVIVPPRQGISRCYRFFTPEGKSFSWSIESTSYPRLSDTEYGQ